MIGGAMCAVLGLAYSIAWLQYKVRLRGRGKVGTADDFIGPFAAMLGWGGLYERVQPLVQRSGMKLAVLEGGCTRERLLRWTAEGLARSYACALAAWAVAGISGNVLIGWMGMGVGSMLLILRARELHRQVEQRRTTMLMELPVLLSRLLVLVNAGENVRRALVRTAERRPANKHPLYEELAAALVAMDRGENMNQAMEQFGRRCAVPEVKQFASMLLMNARRGGEAFVPALRDLTRQMWEKRKAAARTLGEQASSRLAFPLAVILLLIIVLVGAPAMMIMNG